MGSLPRGRQSDMVYIIIHATVAVMMATKTASITLAGFRFTYLSGKRTIYLRISTFIYCCERQAPIYLPRSKQTESSIDGVPNGTKNASDASHQNENRYFIVFVWQQFEWTQIEKTRIRESFPSVKCRQHNIQCE